MLAVLPLHSLIATASVFPYIIYIPFKRNTLSYVTSCGDVWCALFCICTMIIKNWWGFFSLPLFLPLWVIYKHSHMLGKGHSSRLLCSSVICNLEQKIKDRMHNLHIGKKYITKPQYILNHNVIGMIFEWFGLFSPSFVLRHTMHNAQ